VSGLVSTDWRAQVLIWPGVSNAVDGKETQSAERRTAQNACWERCRKDSEVDCGALGSVVETANGEGCSRNRRRELNWRVGGVARVGSTSEWAAGSAGRSANLRVARCVGRNERGDWTGEGNSSLSEMLRNGSWKKKDGLWGKTLRQLRQGSVLEWSQPRERERESTAQNLKPTGNTAGRDVWSHGGMLI